MAEGMGFESRVELDVGLVEVTVVVAVVDVVLAEEHGGVIDVSEVSLLSTYPRHDSPVVQDTTTFSFLLHAPASEVAVSPGVTGDSWLAVGGKLLLEALLDSPLGAGRSKDSRSEGTLKASLGREDCLHTSPVCSV